MPVDRATVPVTDEGLLRGDGVFEVVALYDGVPYALDEHLERMALSAAGLRLEGFSAALFAADVACVLAAAGEDAAGTLRLVATRGGRRIVINEPAPTHVESLALVTLADVPRRLLDDIKSLSYAANMLASRLARERGADEALLVTPYGRVLEGPRQSFVCSLDGETLVTPPLSDHILDSITRRRLVESGLVGERSISIDELPFALEAFLASTTREVHPVRSIDGVALAATPGPLTLRAGAALREAVARATGSA